MTKKVTPMWPELLREIDLSWKAKKGRGYMFAGKDLKLLKQLTSWFTVPEVLALWLIFLRRSPFWGAKTGYLIEGMWAERSVLLDDPEFKKLTAENEKKLGFREQQELLKEFGLDKRNT